MRGRCRVPGDKSISHRAALLAALAPGRSVLRGFSSAGDCDRTLAVLAALGVEASRDGEVLMVQGGRALREPAGPLHCGRSGTTMRLVAGTLAAAPFASTLTGERQLLRRPMARVAGPLRRMGAEVRLSSGDRPPMSIRGGSLAGIEHVPDVPSAQVKSSVLVAGLHASGRTVVVEAGPTRDHTERLLEAMGAPIERSPGGRVCVERGTPSPLELDVPGDLSSAAFLVAAATLLPGSDLTVEGVGLNPTRTGFLDVLDRMGGAVERTVTYDALEPRGDLRVRHASLTGIRLLPEEVPGVIDELPLIGLLATQGEGITEVRGAGELRVKESDRIAGLVAGLNALGAYARGTDDGFVVRGPTRLREGRCDARRDHRLAMTFAVAGLIADGPVRVDGLEFASDSFPGFDELMGELR